MALDGCGVICKYVLVVFNIIFALVGFAFLFLGLWLRFSYSTRGIFQMKELNSSAFVIGVTVLIVLGSVMLIVVVFGEYGAFNEKRCALAVFGALVTLLIGGTLLVGLLAFFMRDKLGSQMEEFYASLYLLYVLSGDPALAFTLTSKDPVLAFTLASRDRVLAFTLTSRDPVLAITLTAIHNGLECCGLTGIPIVEVVNDTCPKPSGFLQHFVMKSCPGIIVNVFETKASLVLGIFLGTGALLITAFICAAVLDKQIKKSDQAIEAHCSESIEEDGLMSFISPMNAS